MTLSTHVLDTARGRPAAGIAIELFALGDHGRRTLLTSAITNADGRTDTPLHADGQPGTYELVFAVGTYFANLDVATFFDQIPLRFVIADAHQRYHVPLLLAPWGYSTYRGS
jgi:5-hydroxyisourate hydrolase